MRNFDERMAEIRSRSKTRIAKRKKYIATGTSVFAFCVALVGTLFLPNAVPTTVHATEATVSEEIYIGNTTLYYDTGDIASISEDGKDILQFIDSLNAYPANIYSTTGVQKTASEDVTQRITYRFEISDNLGMFRTFTLCGDILTDEDNQIVYLLDSNQQLRLMRLLKVIKE